MGKVVRSCTAIGAFVIAAVIGIGSSVWPEYIRPYPYEVVGLGVFGLGMLLFPVIYKLATQWAIDGESTLSLGTLGEPIQDMQIELIEHGKFSSELLLECINHGGPLTLTASLRIVGASPGLAYKSMGYQGAWVKPVSLALNSVGMEYDSKPTAYLPTGSSAYLRIATIDAPQKPEGNAYMHLDRRDEWATWDLEHAPTTDLPYFIVKIEIRANGKNNVLRRTYKVGPPLRNESLRMVECSV